MNWRGRLEEALTVAVIVVAIAAIGAAYYYETPEADGVWISVDTPPWTIRADTVEFHRQDQPDPYVRAFKGEECSAIANAWNLEYLGLPGTPAVPRPPECPYTRFVFYTDVEVTMDEDGNVVVEVVQ